MKQVIHIFRKDVRHHWPVIVLCQAALLGYVWHEIRGWKSVETYLGFARYLPASIYIALFLTWWLLIFRVVQDESMVGDRQFWITRPYEWKKLLVAKVLMLLVFINLPLFCAQIFFLAEAHFMPLPSLLGVLYMQLLLLMFPFLPMVAMAAVTRNIAQGLLGILSVILFVAAMLALDEYMPKSAEADAFVSDWMQEALLVIACIMAIWVQYKWRRTARARMFLASAPIALIVIFVLAPYFVHANDDASRPSENSAAFPVALYGKPPASKIPPDKDEDVAITIPVFTMGPQAGYMAQISSARLRLESENGVRWDSKWQGLYNSFLPGQSKWTQDFSISYKEFEKLKSLRWKATVSFKVEIFQDHDARQIKAGDGEFEIPGVGLCRVNTKRFDSMDCHSPLVKPENALLQVNSADTTCPLGHTKEEQDNDSASDAPADGNSFTWESHGDQRPAEYGLDPVASFTLYFREAADYRSALRICPGTPITLSFPVSVQNMRAGFEIDQFNLEEYRREPFRFSSFGLTLKR
jgi:hypothetical protein